MNYLDLHVHSNASDGTLTPSEVVCLAKKTGLCAIALTDHDTVEGVDEAVAAGREYHIEVVPGVELSCAYISREIHIVGLFVDCKNTGFLDELARLKDTRAVRNEQMAEKCREQGMSITMEELLAEYPDAVITRAHFAALLAKKGYVSSVKDAFERYLNDHGPCFVPRYKMPCTQTIELIHSAGGLAILAHPILYKLGNTELAKLVSYLTKCGLDGIEALYSTYTASDERRIEKLAKENTLLISGGSDFHGANKPHIQLGTRRSNMKISYEILEKLKKAKV